MNRLATCLVLALVVGVASAAPTYGDMIRAQRAGTNIDQVVRETVRTVIKTTPSNAVVRMVRPDGVVSTNTVRFHTIRNAKAIAADHHADDAIRDESNALLAAFERARGRDDSWIGGKASAEAKQAAATAMRVDRMAMEAGEDPLTPIGPGAAAGAGAAAGVAIGAGLKGLIKRKEES
jgi:hypothetical protein